jgi:Zn-dependent protease/CBS domain-containing protein
MFGRKIPLFTLLGFKVGIDVTWFILAALVTWSLADGLFPYYIKGLSTATYWWMGGVGAVGLFFSIVFHEFCHSLVARRYGLPMKGITLFIFGGVAEMSDEPASPKAEFLMSVVGPLSSVFLAGVFYVIEYAGRGAFPMSVAGILIYLAAINALLAAFNMIPAFPLDGGRVLRSILWAIKGNLRWATHVASWFGSAFGILLMVLGVISFIGQNFIGGIWFFLIGMFIRSASQMSYRQMLMRDALSGEPISRFMKTDPVTVPAAATVAELVEDYFYRYHYKMFPVAHDGRVDGCVSIKEIKRLPKGEWASHTVSEIVTPCSEQNTITPDADAMKALSIMNTTGNSRLMVVEGDKLDGIITLKDMLRFLAMKIDLEHNEKVNLPAS